MIGWLNGRVFARVGAWVENKTSTALIEGSSIMHVEVSSSDSSIFEGVMILFLVIAPCPNDRNPETWEIKITEELIVNRFIVRQFLVTNRSFESRKSHFAPLLFPAGELIHLEKWQPSAPGGHI